MNIFQPIIRTAEALLDELKRIFKDQGALLFCVLLPLAYPLVYSWIYNNETVHDVPVAVVDNSHSALSREFIQRMDATPEVRASLFCGDMEEARSAVGHGKVFGIIYFPEDFATKVGRMEQTRVSVYCDMSYMLTYKAIFSTCTNISLLMGNEITASLMNAQTSREAEIAAHPLRFDEVPIFNTTAGYGNFILPGVLVLILQQAMLLVVGMLSGTDRERRWDSVEGILSTFIGKSLAYFLVFFVMSAYVLLVVPRLFSFVSLIQFRDWLALVLPYLMSCSFFSICISSLVRYRENVMLIVVFSSLPILFMSGVSWPQSNIPGYIQTIADLFPSTMGIRAFVKMNSMGATLYDCMPELRALFIQIIAYGVLGLFVIYRRRRMIDKLNLETPNQ